MPIELKDTIANQIEILDDGMTLAELLHAVGWYNKEKQRWKISHVKRYKPTGKPVGRPKKTPDTSENTPAKPVGRPKKTPDTSEKTPAKPIGRPKKTPDTLA